MSLVLSLLQAIIHVDGEALVMHAGDKPYVVTPTGQVDLASRGLALDAMNGIVSQLLPPELQRALDEFGAVQYELPAMPEFSGEHFSVVAARGGDDLWVEIRRRRIPEDDRIPDELFVPREEAAKAQPYPVYASAGSPDLVPRAEPIPDSLELQPSVEPVPVAVASVQVVEPVPVVREHEPEAIEEEVELPSGSQPWSDVEISLDPAGDADISHAEAAPIEMAIAPVSHEAPVPEEPAPAILAPIALEPPPLVVVPPPVEAAPPPPIAIAPPPVEPAVAVVAPRVEEAPSPIAFAPAAFAVVARPSVAAPQIAVEPSPVSIEPQPVAIEPPTPIVMEPQPVAIEPPVPIVMEPQPVAIERPVPIPMEPQPVAIEPPAPIVMEPQPVAIELPVPIVTEPQPVAIAPMSVAVGPSQAVVESPSVAAAAVPVSQSATGVTRPVMVAPQEIADMPPAPASSYEPPLMPLPIEPKVEAVRRREPSPPIPSTSLEAGLSEAEGSGLSTAEGSGLSEVQGPAVVLPLARNPIRLEQPPLSVDDPTMSGLDRLLRLSAARGASTLYLSSESRASVRVDGELQVLEGEPTLTSRDVESLLLTLMPERSHEALRTGSATEWICDIEDVGRVRCMSFRDHRGPGGVFRLMPTRSVSADQLGLSRAVQGLAIEPEGLVLVAGPRSSGKRTLLSAFVDLINRTRRDHVITIEREINIVHERGSSFISQREVRGGDDDMLAAARAALREDPDVLLIEDLRTADLMNVALEAATSGHLVVGGFSAHTAAGAVDRIIDLYAPEYRRQVQFALADSLRGVIVQLLLKKRGGGRVAAREVLLNTPAVSSVIAEGKTSQLPMAIEGGRRYGMMPLNDALVGLVQQGIVDGREAYRYASDRPGLLAVLKRQGVDTSFVEKLA